MKTKKDYLKEFDDVPNDPPEQEPLVPVPQPVVTCPRCGNVMHVYTFAEYMPSNQGIGVEESFRHSCTCGFVG